jgi:peptidoglycan lytic transglycosylase G
MEPVVTRSQRTAVVVIVLVVVPMVVLASGAMWFWTELHPLGGAGSKTEVQIAPGLSISSIGDELAHKGVIDSSLVFSVYARLNGDTRFEAGTYELRKHMGVSAAVRSLKAGPKINYSLITIPPGLWLTEIAQRVAKIPGMNAQTFLQSAHNKAVRSSSQFEPSTVNNLEGLLWADTYKVSADEDEIQVLKTMANTFIVKATALGLQNANVQGHGAYDIVTIASMIEAEAKTDADRPLIASVIYNRLARGMPLQIDATLIYARGNAKNRSLSDADKQINSPYNTYAHTGLPPTPIAAVSQASLEAAMNPATTTYLYYVVIDKQGDHAFASTLAEQNANIQKARENGVLP